MPGLSSPFPFGLSQTSCPCSPSALSNDNLTPTVPQSALSNHNLTSMLSVCSVLSQPHPHGLVCCVCECQSDFMMANCMLEAEEHLDVVCWSFTENCFCVAWCNDLFYFYLMRNPFKTLFSQNRSLFCVLRVQKVPFSASFLALQ